MTPKKVRLFDGTLCSMCVLVVGGRYGTAACWGASYLAELEIDATSFFDLLPDGAFESEDADHEACIVTMSMHLSRYYDGDCDVDITINRFIPVSIEDAIKHRDGKVMLWIDESDEEMKTMLIGVSG